MDSKLTLKLNSDIIQEAKNYEKESNTSLSKLIENYLSALVSENKNKKKVNPIVKSLTGIITLEDEKDYKKSYTKHLIKKYK
jgi:predicted metalloendopeptidase